MYESFNLDILSYLWRCQDDDRSYLKSSGKSCLVYINKLQHDKTMSFLIKQRSEHHVYIRVRMLLVNYLVLK